MALEEFLLDLCEESVTATLLVRPEPLFDTLSPICRLGLLDIPPKPET